MAIARIEVEGRAARELVLRSWPAATSCFTGADAAEIYDATTGTMLGAAQAAEHPVEHAWIEAASNL